MTDHFSRSGWERVPHEHRLYAEGRVRKKRYKEIVNRLKERTACKDCGNHYPARAMDFDHVYGKKNFNIATVVATGAVSPAYLLAEIRKCEIVCSNCHRIRTQKRHEARKNVE